MSTHADKTKKNPAKSSPAKTVQKQHTNTSSSRITDHRAKTAAQRKLQELKGNTSRTRQLKASQEMMQNNPRVNQLKEIQNAAEEQADRKITRLMKAGEKETKSPQAKSGTVQKKPETPQNTSKENKTGLPDNLKSGVEKLSGKAMDDVKVHYNSDKPAQLHAHAYTQGTDIHVAPGQEKHLPHEAWHAVQQKQGRVKPTAQLKSEVPVNDDKGLEKEADIMGAKALSAVQKKEDHASGSQSVKTEGGVLQPVVQRKALDADIILKKVPEVLAGNSLLPKDEELKLDTELFEGTTLKARIEAIISTYESQFQKDESPTAVTHNAQKVLAAFQTIGVVIARKLHMGGEGHKIAKALLASQKDRLISELKTNTSKDESSNALSEKDAGDVLKTAEVLIGDDPVGMYVQDKTSLKKADASIRAMAGQLDKKPLEVFELLRQQFESRIGSLNLDQVKKGEVEAPEGYTFALKDLYGEVSEKFFKNLLDLDEGKPKWGESGLVKNPKPEGWKDQSRTFELNDINTLRDSVKKKKEKEEEFTISEETQKEKGWERLNKSQMEYLTGVEEEESGQKSSAKERLITYFKEEKSKSQEEAEKAVNDGVGNLKKWPITLTTKAQDMVKKNGEIVDTYKPFFSVFQEEKRINDFLPNLQTDTTIKIVEDVLGRGLDYGQQRKEKDEQQIGFDSPLSLEDLPAMSCINYQYLTSKGSNYYGDTHFVLNPAVRGRAAYSYGTDCPERRDYYLLLNDILGKEPKTVDQICEGAYIAQDIEVHVYGNIDLKKDIIEFHLGDPNTLVDADTKKAQDGLVTSGFPGSSPTAKLITIKTLFPKTFEDVKKIWIKKQKGTEKLKELIKDLPEEVKSNIEALQETKTIDEGELSKAPSTSPTKTTTTTSSTGGGKKKKFCYITTACVTARDLPDDCEELETLRYFRDTYMLHRPGGTDLVKFYYEQAPRIVEAINGGETPEAVYEELYGVIRGCVEAVQEERNEDAFATYVTMVLKLKDIYTPDMEVPEPLLEASRNPDKASATVV